MSHVLPDWRNSPGRKRGFPPLYPVHDCRNVVLPTCHLSHASLMVMTSSIGIRTPPIFRDGCEQPKAHEPEEDTSREIVRQERAQRERDRQDDGKRFGVVHCLCGWYNEDANQEGLSPLPFGLLGQAVD